MFLGRKILASIFSGSLIQVGIFLSTQNNLKIRDSSWYDPHVSRLCVVPLEIFMVRKFDMGFFGGLSFGPGIFWGLFEALGIFFGFDF